MINPRRIFSVLILPILLFLSCTTSPQSLVKDSRDKGNLCFENGRHEESMIKDSFDKGNLYFENGWYEESITSYSQAITTSGNKNGPNVTAAFYNRGLAYLMRNNYDKAILDFTSVITLNPEDAQAYHCRGNVWRRKQCSDKAINDFNMAIEKDPHNMDSYYALGMTYFKQNNYWKTVQILSRAIAIDPNFAKAYNGRGQAYMQTGMIAKAIPDFRKACDMGEECGCIMLELIAKQAHQLTCNN
jgi:tetratricopeptide (TPR) repeat protein